MSKTLHEAFEEFNEAVDALKAALWEERWYFITFLGSIWLASLLAVIAFEF